MEKTSTYKSYEFGFVLSEQELRRIVQVCYQHILKHVDEKNCRQIIKAYLADGAIVESATVDNILSLDNTGSKSIEGILLHFNDGKMDYEKESAPDPEWGIWVRFLNPITRSDTWTSVSCLIIGQSRDWAFLLSSELEERIKKIKTTSFAYIFSRRYFFAIPAAIAFALSMIGAIQIDSTKYENIPATLELLYRNGQIKDPIEAIILTEQMKQSAAASPERTANMLIFIILSFAIPFGIAWIVENTIPYFAPAYNFYWGDYVKDYDKKRTALNIFWTVFILGIIVSIISAYILRVMP